MVAKQGVMNQSDSWWGSFISHRQENFSENQNWIQAENKNVW
jgi:hypothetical protein